MKISSKARYGLASMIYIAKNCSHNECITIINIANSLKISKIYLEQVFSLLKRANLVISIKGAQGGYQLARSIDSITAKDIIGAIELSLFDKTDTTVLDSSEAIEKAMEYLVWNKLDEDISKRLSSITLRDLVEEADKFNNPMNTMFYI